MDLKIISVRGFDSWNVDYIISQMIEVEFSDQPAHIFEITSFGGYAYTLQKLLDYTTSCKKPLIGVASGACASCGSIFFSSLDYRLLGQNSSLLIHEPSGISWGKYSDQKADLSDMKNLVDWMYSIYDTSAGKKSGYFEDLVYKNNNADLVLNPKEAKTHNLIDGTGSLIDIIENLDEIVKKCGGNKRIVGSYKLPEDFIINEQPKHDEDSEDI